MLKAEAISLLEGFIARISNGVQYVIPVYQRNYTWKKDSVVKLLSDIKLLLDKKRDAHFLGNLIYVQTKADFRKKEWAIVDGQQRLTTLFLLLYAIRNHLLLKNKKDDADEITNLYLENVNAKDENYKLRLKPLVSNDDEFKRIANNLEAANDDSLIRINYKVIQKEIKSWLEQYSVEKIIAAIEKLYIVYIALDMNDNAQQIFESINSNGVQLNKSDLIRNFVLMNKEDMLQTKLYKNYWREIEKNVNDDNKKLEAFFRFYLATKNFVLSSISDLYEDFIIFWNNLMESSTDEAILSDILKFSVYYNKLFIDKSWAKRKEIEILRKIQSDMPTPLLFGIMDLFQNEKITNEQFEKCIMLVNTFILRRHMCNLDTSSISRFFATILKDMLDKCNSIYVNIADVLGYCLENAQRQKSSYMPNDDEIRQVLSKINAYVLVHTRTFFEIIEDESKIKIDKSNLTIEHVMPQTQDEDGYWKNAAGNISDDEYAKLVNLIGNLTFADKSTNSSIKNKNFETKKIRLAEVGKIDLSKDILSKHKWGQKEIKDRTTDLIDKFMETFPFFTSQIDYDAKNTYQITYNQGGIVGKGRLYVKTKKVIIDNDSEIKVKGSEYRDIKDEELINSMFENNEIEKIEDKYILKTELSFSSVSAAAKFIFDRSCNGWIEFKDEDGNLLNKNLRKLTEE